MGCVGRISLSESDIKRLVSLNHDPHPRDFERFIPWLFHEFNIRNIKIQRLAQAEYQPVEVVRALAKKSKKHLSNKNFHSGLVKKDSGASSKTLEYILEPSSINILADNVTVTILAYYDNNGALVEIAFIDCPVPVPTDVFMVIHLCLPFNPHLTRITWKGARLTSALIHEISKIIPGSEISDVILDGCYVPQGNYYILLDHATKLKYLSLSNCKINDAVCEMIAERIKRNGPAAENLVALNLSSNRITDVGAEALGCSLRTNRRLLYLNLSNNDITSIGAGHILLPLAKFALNPEENMDMRLLKLNLAKEKVGASNKGIKDITNVYYQEKQTQDANGQKSKANKKLNAVHSHFEGIESDIYLGTVTEEKKGSWSSLGNFALCALNLAHNRLDWTIISRIADVVSYQCRVAKSNKTGLLRVVIEGNSLPTTCDDYDLINKYIELAIDKATPEPPVLHAHTPHAIKTTKSRMSRSEQRTN